MSDLAALAAFFAAFVLALVSPGPAFALVLGTALRGGRPAALRVALGLALGDLFWGTLAVVGVAALAAQHPWIATVIRIAGGAFLLYMAVGSLRAAFRKGGHDASVTDDVDEEAARRGVRHGFAVNALNPKCGVFWLSLTGILMRPEMAWTIPATAVTVATLLSFCWFAVLSFAFTTPKVVAGYRRIERGVEAALGAVLGALGLKLLAAW